VDKSSIVRMVNRLHGKIAEMKRRPELGREACGEATGSATDLENPGRPRADADLFHQPQDDPVHSIEPPEGILDFDDIVELSRIHHRRNSTVT
jgi:hypothetical protein